MSEEIEVLREPRGVSGVRIWGTPVEIQDVIEDDGTVIARCDVRGIGAVNVASYPKRLIIDVWNEQGFGTSPFDDISLERDAEDLHLVFSCDRTDEPTEVKQGLAPLLVQIAREAGSDGKLEVREDDLDLNYPWLILRLQYSSKEYQTIGEWITDACDRVKAAIRRAEIALGGRS